MSAAEKLNMHKVNLSPMDKLSMSIHQAIESGVRVADIQEAIEIMRAVRIGKISTLTVRQDNKDKRALWVRGSNYVKRIT